MFWGRSSIPPAEYSVLGPGSMHLDYVYNSIKQTSLHRQPVFSIRSSLSREHTVVESLQSNVSLLSNGDPTCEVRPDQSACYYRGRSLNGRLPSAY